MRFYSFNCFRFFLLAASFCITSFEVRADGALRVMPFESNLDRFDPNLWYISDGWSNGDHQNCTWSRKAVSMTREQGLTLSFLPKSALREKAFCGEVQTRNRFKYGTFEAWMNANGGSGLNAAFFSYIGPVHKQPHDEIDFEMLTRSPGRIWLNRFVDGKDFGEGSAHQAEVRPPDEFYHLAFVWEPARLRWYVDGDLVKEVTNGVPSRAMKIYFSHWGTDQLWQWMGRFDPIDAPVQMTVRRFTYTPLGQECVFEGSVTCQP